MTYIDIRDLALHLRTLIAGMNSHMTRGPLTVMVDDEPAAMIIRSDAYAPRLHNFSNRMDGDVSCGLCHAVVVNPNPYNLATGLEAANEHWRATHQEPRRRASGVSGLCRAPHPAGWDRCVLGSHHNGPHGSGVGEWGQQ